MWTRTADAGHRRHKTLSALSVFTPELAITGDGVIKIKKQQNILTSITSFVCVDAAAQCYKRNDNNIF